MKAQFERILERYDMPKNANWKPLEGWVELAGYNMPQEEEKKGLMYMDEEALIRLILLLESSESVEVKGEAVSVRLEEANLQKYLLLSLHKLLQLKWGFDKPSEEERKKGMQRILAKGSENKMIEVGIKGRLEGEEGDFIQPYTQDELQALLELSIRLKNYNKIRQGRGKDVAFLGDKLAKVNASIPDEAKEGKNKTDLLNFMGEVMALAGFLKNHKKWNELSEELDRCERNGLLVSDIRKARKNKLEYWLRSARKTYCKADLGHCNKCKDFGKCAISSHLKVYEV